MMTDKSLTFKTKIHGWTFRIKVPTIVTKQTKVLVLLHGHLGDENAMWILTKPLPENIILLAPRAPVKLGEHQFSWHKIDPQWPGIDLYQDLTDQLLRRVDTWVKDNTQGITRYDIMGFSQGAVMAYALAILHPDRVNRSAAIAGFIPNHWKSKIKLVNLSNKRFFIAHGTQDNIVPVEKANQAAQCLREFGANVQLCTAETGHKISANCFNGLGEFFGK